MSTLSIVANVLNVTVLNNNAKVVVLLVSTWIFVTILSSMDINVSQSSSPPPPMYYYTSLKNDHKIRKIQKTSSNKIEIDTNFLEEVDSAEIPEEDIFYDIKNGNIEELTKKNLSRIWQGDFPHLKKISEEQFGYHFGLKLYQYAAGRHYDLLIDEEERNEQLEGIEQTRSWVW